MLILARKLNERIVIGDDIEVSVVEIKGDQVKLGISAPRNVSVYRHEVYEAIQAENRMAARSQPDIPEFNEWLEKQDSDPGSQNESDREKNSNRENDQGREGTSNRRTRGDGDNSTAGR